MVLLNQTGQSSGGFGRTVVQCAERLGSLGQSRIDARNILQCLSNELRHAGRCMLSAET